MNQLKTKIEEVKAKLGLKQMQLSERIGKNPYYLDTVKHRGITTERQEELIRELDLVANGGTVMTERAVITELTEKADALQSRLNSAHSANKELCLKLELAERQYRHIEGMYDSNLDKLQETNELVASLQEYKRQYRNLVATVLVIGIISILGFALWSAM